MSTTTISIAAPALSGLVGALLGAWGTGRQQRSAQLRQRMLDAATELVDAVQNATVLLTPEPSVGGSETDSAITAARHASRRVDLIFGPDSAVAVEGWEAASDITLALWGCQKPLDVDDRIEGSEATARAIWDADRQHEQFTAEKSLDSFARLAGRAIRTGGRHPWLDRLDRWRHHTPWSLRRRRTLKDLQSAARAYRIAIDETRTAYAALRAQLDEQPGMSASD